MLSQVRAGRSLARTKRLCSIIQIVRMWFYAESVCGIAWSLSNPAYESAATHCAVILFDDCCCCFAVHAGKTEWAIG